MHQPYVSFLLLLVFVAANAALLIGLSHFAAPRRPTPVKLAPYESGMPPLGDAHERFSVKFYLVAMLFIVFDIETVFLIPWGVIYFASGEAAGGGGGRGGAGDGVPTRRDAGLPRDPVRGLHLRVEARSISMGLSA